MSRWRCSRTCDDASPCPDGFRCEVLEDRDGRPTNSQCAPVSGFCPDEPLG